MFSINNKKNVELLFGFFICIFYLIGTFFGDGKTFWDYATFKDTQDITKSAPMTPMTPTIVITGDFPQETKIVSLFL